MYPITVSIPFENIQLEEISLRKALRLFCSKVIGHSPRVVDHYRHRAVCKICKDRLKVWFDPVYKKVNVYKDK